MNALTVIDNDSNVEAYRASTNAASLCKEIVVATASEIQRRRYVSVEGWQAIAVAHGCAAGSRDVERVDGGFRAIGEVRRMSDGQLIAQAEGFVGEDEATWFGGDVTDRWGKSKTLPKRPDYAIRAMAQTRAISRACRSAFAHVVVLMDAGLATTPAEEVPHGGFDDHSPVAEPANAPANDAPAEPRRDEPAPREKLEGKHSSKTALKEALQHYTSKIIAAESSREVDAIVKEYAADLAQGERYLPIWMNGDPNNEDKKGLVKLTNDRRAFWELVEDMRRCQTAKSLTGWMADREADVESLDDGARRQFEREYANHEVAINAMDQVSS